MVGALVVGVTQTAWTQDAECLSPLTKYDVCAHAQKMQKGMAPSLPMQISSDIILERVAAFGPRVAFYASWTISSPDLSAVMAHAGTSKAALKAKLAAYTPDMVCGQKVSAAFVRLGGEIQYFYRLNDGTPFTDVLVDGCPYVGQ